MMLSGNLEVKAYRGEGKRKAKNCTEKGARLKTRNT